jgi:DNA primase
MAFPPGFLDELRARLSLSDLVGRKVALKRRSGSEHAGLCPFHNEKSPSFTVNDKKGFFHCFGCGAHGDAVGFTMKTEGLSFPEAVEKLAREVGLPVPRATPAERERAERAASLLQVVEMAATWFQKQLRLPSGRQALDYLRGRGLEEQTIEDFRLGFALDARDGLLGALRREGIPTAKIVEAGLAIQPDDEREPYDRFRGRVMFPINDRRGRIIAFGGRVMGAGEPKYLNSPETPLFHKGANLYCLDRARAAAAHNQPVVVAEGYMDVIALHGAGFAGAVAPLGTALTEGQLSELWRLADEPYLCFDGDNAGRRAAARAAERALPLLQPGKSLRFLALPAGEDPDSLIRTRGADAMRRVLASARPLADLVWEMETEGRPLDTPERRANLQRAVERRVADIADPVVRDYYRTEMRDRLDRMRRPDRTPWQPRLRRSFAEPAARQGPFAPGMAALRGDSDRLLARDERVLLGALIERPAMLRVLAEELAHLPIGNPELVRLRSGLLDALALVPGGLDPVAEEAMGEGGLTHTPLEARLLEEHLERSGLGRVASTARTKAREAFRGDQARPDGWVESWRRKADYIKRLAADLEELVHAQLALAEDATEDNNARLAAIVNRIHREALESGAE